MAWLVLSCSTNLSLLMYPILFALFSGYITPLPKTIGAKQPAIRRLFGWTDLLPCCVKQGLFYHLGYYRNDENSRQPTSRLWGDNWGTRLYLLAERGQSMAGK